MRKYEDGGCEDVRIVVGIVETGTIGGTKAYSRLHVFCH